jgi:hypothetical protein
MSIPYASTTSGEKALRDAQKILTQFGCNKFGHWIDTDVGSVTVQFEWQGRAVQIEASAKGWAAMYLRENPWNYRRALDQVGYERKALEQGSIAVYSMLRDWIKGQVTAVESGILTFEGAFLGQILLPSGRTVLQHIETEKMLAAPEET